MKLWKRISLLTARASTNTLIVAFFLIGVSCILPLELNHAYREYKVWFISAMFFFWGLSGLPIIIRQDADFGLVRIEGWLAVTLGVLLLLSGFALALLPLWMYLS